MKLNYKTKISENAVLNKFATYDINDTKYHNTTIPFQEPSCLGCVKSIFSSTMPLFTFVRVAKKFTKQPQQDSNSKTEQWAYLDLSLMATNKC